MNPIQKFVTSFLFLFLSSFFFFFCLNQPRHLIVPHDKCGGPQFQMSIVAGLQCEGPTQFSPFCPPPWLASFPGASRLTGDQFPNWKLMLHYKWLCVHVN